MKKLSIIWLIFVLLFISLGFFHLNASRKSISPFQLSERPFDKYVSAEIAGADIDKPLKDFARDFNSYLGDYNKSSRKQNRIAASGYFLALLTAIFSMVLTFYHQRR